MVAATATDGVCQMCASATGLASGCATACPDCVNTVEGYLTACQGFFLSLNYGTLEAYTAQLSTTNDCYDWLNEASRPYAAVYCGDGFDHVVQYSQSAAASSVVVTDGVMTTPYSCLQANATFCPARNICTCNHSL